MPSIHYNYSYTENSNKATQERKKTDESDISMMSEQTSKRNELIGPVYEVQHLATFTVGSKHGLLRADDGMRKLRLMERSQGVWTMDCEIMIDKRFLVILDKKTGQEAELVPLSLIHEPTSVINDDKKDIYNNILLFTVLEDPKKKSSSQSEMHIFQCLKNHSTEIVDEILRAKATSNGDKKPDIRPQTNNNLITDEDFENHRQNLLMNENINGRANANGNHLIAKRYPNNNNNNNDNRQSLLPNLNSNPLNTASYLPYSESIDQDVQILNHCFDDIERFVTRLQNASDYLKELERRKNQRKSRKKQIGDGLLGMRAQMPPQQHFVDIFQKFKLSFNLLAKLKAHIHDPNAPELVHFLFTPLSLIINASKDLQSNRGLTKTVWSPLLTKNAKELLLNCLTSKEQDLWQSLGDSWTICKEEAKVHQQYVEPYNPIFYNGWAPNLEQSDTRSEISRLAFTTTVQPTSNSQSQHNPTIYNHSKTQIKPQQQQQQQQQLPPSQLQHYQQHPQSQNHQSKHKNNVINNNLNSYKENDMKVEWANNLVLKGSKIFEVINGRQGNNEKELSVKTNELVEVLDDRRNWWRVKNFHGQIGHVPNNLLKLYEIKSNLSINNNANHEINNNGFQSIDDKMGYF